MLTRLDLTHFKCFELLKLPLERLTLLSGTNASGKSSALQALVLLHQTIQEHEWSTRLLLNGGELSLGTITDVVDKVTGRRSFGIGLIDHGRAVHWVFEGEGGREDMSATVSTVHVGGDEYKAPKELHLLLPPNVTGKDRDLVERLGRLCYLTAERVGPREVYPLGDPNRVHAVGPRGEYAASLLHWGRDQRVLSQLLLEGEIPTLLHQVGARMREFFPGSSLQVQQVPQTNGVMLGLRTSDATDYHRPIHVGFGLTQVLPIIVAALSARQGDLLLIENPEVHLHPGGQGKMGSFLAAVAAAGIQVMIETHSDHVLNGVRRAVKGRVLDSEQVMIHFFKDRDAKGEQVISPTIDQNGSIDSWPDGFFDQFDKDMNHFAGWEG